MLRDVFTKHLKEQVDLEERCDTLLAFSEVCRKEHVKGIHPLSKGVFDPFHNEDSASNTLLESALAKVDGETMYVPMKGGEISFSPDFDEVHSMHFFTFLHEHPDYTALLAEKRPEVYKAAQQLNAAREYKQHIDERRKALDSARRESRTLAQDYATCEKEVREAENEVGSFEGKTASRSVIAEMKAAQQKIDPVKKSAEETRMNLLASEEEVARLEEELKNYALEKDFGEVLTNANSVPACKGLIQGIHPRVFSNKPPRKEYDIEEPQVKRSTPVQKQEILSPEEKGRGYGVLTAFSLIVAASAFTLGLSYMVKPKPLVQEIVAPKKVVEKAERLPHKVGRKIMDGLFNELRQRKDPAIKMNIPLYSTLVTKNEIFLTPEEVLLYDSHDRKTILFRSGGGQPRRFAVYNHNQFYHDLQTPSLTLERKTPTNCLPVYRFTMVQDMLFQQNVTGESVRCEVKEGIIALTEKYFVEAKMQLPYDKEWRPLDEPFEVPPEKLGPNTKTQIRIRGPLREEVIPEAYRNHDPDCGFWLNLSNEYRAHISGNPQQ